MEGTRTEGSGTPPTILWSNLSVPAVCKYSRASHIQTPWDQPILDKLNVQTVHFQWEQQKAYYFGLG